jgi:hypothetical protein
MIHFVNRYKDVENFSDWQIDGFEVSSEVSQRLRYSLHSGMQRVVSISTPQTASGSDAVMRRLLRTLVTDLLIDMHAFGFVKELFGLCLMRPICVGFIVFCVLSLHYCWRLIVGRVRSIRSHVANVVLRLSNAKFSAI